jgi:hypothetical protein
MILPEWEGFSGIGGFRKAQESAKHTALENAFQEVGQRAVILMVQHSAIFLLALFSDKLVFSFTSCFFDQCFVLSILCSSLRRFQTISTYSTKANYSKSFRFRFFSRPLVWFSLFFLILSFFLSELKVPNRQKLPIAKDPSSSSSSSSSSSQQQQQQAKGPTPARSQRKYRKNKDGKQIRYHGPLTQHQYKENLPAIRINHSPKELTISNSVSAPSFDESKMPPKVLVVADTLRTKWPTFSDIKPAVPQGGSPFTEESIPQVKSPSDLYYVNPDPESGTGRPVPLRFAVIHINGLFSAFSFSLILLSYHVAFLCLSLPSLPRRTGRQYKVAEDDLIMLPFEKHLDVPNSVLCKDVYCIGTRKLFAFLLRFLPSSRVSSILHMPMPLLFFLWLFFLSSYLHDFGSSYHSQRLRSAHRRRTNANRQDLGFQKEATKGLSPHQRPHH